MDDFEQARKINDAGDNQSKLSEMILDCHFEKNSDSIVIALVNFEITMENVKLNMKAAKKIAQIISEMDVDMSLFLKLRYVMLETYIKQIETD